jgi:hypothetical protein
MHFLPGLQLDAKALLFVHQCSMQQRSRPGRTRRTASIILASSIAKFLPMHCREPIENGRNANAICFSVSAIRNCCTVCKHTIAFEPTLWLENVWVRIQLRVPGARRLLTSIVTSTYVCSC